MDPPAHLDGSLAGDYGFDPLGLGADPEALKWYVRIFFQCTTRFIPTTLHLLNYIRRLLNSHRD